MLPCCCQGIQADRQTDRQADRQTGRQADRQTGRQADTALDVLLPDIQADTVLDRREFTA